MEPKKRNLSRHFQFQHPTFGTVKKPKSAASWEKTVYFWWYEYLKRNTVYLGLLDSGSDSEICRDFGDPRYRTFKDWWTEDNRGANLFAEPESDTVEKLNGGEVVSEDPAILTLSFPLSLPREFLKKKLDRFLDQYHSGKAGVRHSLFSRAKYQFNGQPNIESLKRDLNVYDRYIENPDVSLIESCKDLWWVDYPKESLKKNFGTSDYSNHKAKENFKLKRQLKRAITAIEATSQGCFPKA
jgi:hypothetical protein